nr:hypothetical protein [Vulcanisaeta sp. JCM 16159]
MSSNGAVVSRPTIPGGASSYGLSFSQSACGAWSLATMGTSPLTNMVNNSLLVVSSLSGGLTLQ